MRKFGSLRAFDPSSHVKATIGQDVKAVTGVAITVQCPFQASPPGKLSWLLNSTTIYDEEVIFFVIEIMQSFIKDLLTVGPFTPLTPKFRSPKCDLNTQPQDWYSDWYTSSRAGRGRVPASGRVIIKYAKFNFENRNHPGSSTLLPLIFDPL